MGKQDITYMGTAMATDMNFLIEATERMWNATPVALKEMKTQQNILKE